jgi:hypothetical protein
LPLLDLLSEGLDDAALGAEDVHETHDVVALTMTFGHLPNQ